MTAADRDKWDERYRAGAYAGRTHPSALLERHIDDLPAGRALDVACGAGRNALFLARHGFRVDAVDVSVAAIERARDTAAAARVDVDFSVADLDDGLPPDYANRRYDLIVVVRYVNLPLLTRLCRQVAPGGALLCEQHLVTAKAVGGPSGSAHRVRRGELLSALHPLEIRYYREGLLADPDARRMSLAQAIAAHGGIFEIDYC